MAFSFLPKEDQYFDLFSRMSEKIQEAAAILVEMLHAEDQEFDTLAKRIKSVEHECDELSHSVTTKLNKSFITPFDREDIYTLAMALDDVCDYIDAAARCIVIYDIHGNDPYAQQLGDVIEKQAAEINGAIYFNAMAALFKDAPDAVKIIKWKEVYETLESATDKGEYVGNIIESIVLKHN
jgi:uncharacterized protein